MIPSFFVVDGGMWVMMWVWLRPIAAESHRSSAELAFGALERKAGVITPELLSTPADDFEEYGDECDYEEPVDECGEMEDEEAECPEYD